jgi:transcriptional regulator with XRE-family HTH domain
MIDRYGDLISLSPLDNWAMQAMAGPTLDTLGGRVAFLRLLKGWSQKDLARESACSQPTISDLEGDKTKEVTARLLWSVAKALGTTPEYLWTGELSPDEAILIAAFRKLSPEQRPIVLRAVGVDLPPAADTQTGSH